VGGGGGVRGGGGNGDRGGRRFCDFARGGDGVQGRGLQRAVVVFGDDKDTHQITRASDFSLSTSSCTEPTLMPPLRFAGSSTFRVTSLGVTSTPSCSGVTTSIGFFFAFMMLGRDA